MDMNVRSGDLWADNPLQVREVEGGGMTLDGFALRFGVPSHPLPATQIAEMESRAQFARFGSQRFREMFHEGSLKRSLNAKPDITLRYQHNLMTLPLGRTTSGTLALSEEGGGLRVLGELPNNEWGRPVRDAVKRGDISGMSIRFGSVEEEWRTESLDDGWKGPVRHVHQARLADKSGRGEISLVDFPAFPATSAAVRALADEIDAEPDALEAAFMALREPDAKLSPEQKDLLVAAVNARTDVPLIDSGTVEKLTQMRERLTTLAG